MASRSELPPELRAAPFTVGAAVTAGITPDRLRNRDLDRPFHGVRVDPAARAEWARFGSFPNARAAEEFALLVSRCRDYAPLLRPGQFFSHEPAARLFKAPLPSAFTLAEPLHVSVPFPARAPRSRGIVGHQTSVPMAVVDRFELPVAASSATWLALAARVGATLSEDDFIAIAEHLVLDPRQLDPYDPRPYATVAELRDLLDSFSGRGARGATAAIEHVREGVESRPETRLRLVLVRAGLPEPEVGVDIFDDAGRWLGRADQLFREFKVISEYDGEQHRTSSTQYDRDETRIENFNRAGYATVRVRKGQLFGRPREAVERVARALRAAGWPG